MDDLQKNNRKPASPFQIIDKLFFSTAKYGNLKYPRPNKGTKIS